MREAAVRACVHHMIMPGPVRLTPQPPLPSFAQPDRHSRTTDEDGKSNIWAYEAKEEVEVTKGNSGLIVLGLALAVFVGAIAYLPQLQFPSYD